MLRFRFQKAPLITEERNMQITTHYRTDLTETQYAWSAHGIGDPHCGHTESGRGEEYVSGFGGSVQAIAGDFCGFGVQAFGFAGVGEVGIWVDCATGLASGRGEGVCGVAETMDRGADVCVDRQASPHGEGLRAKHRIQQGDHLHRHDCKNAKNTRKKRKRQLKTRSKKKHPSLPFLSRGNE